MEVSNLLTTTRDRDYIKEHGIRKNYSAIVFIGISKFFSLNTLDVYTKYPVQTLTVYGTHRILSQSIKLLEQKM